LFKISVDLTKQVITETELTKRIYPRLFGTYAFIILLGLLVPISGITLCIVKFYVLKRNRIVKLDEKSYEKKTTIYSIVLVFLLFALFFSTVILFASNQNAHRAIKVISNDLEINLERGFNFKKEKFNQLKAKLENESLKVEERLFEIIISINSN
jgi:uncharacterized membrane protein